MAIENRATVFQQLRTIRQTQERVGRRVEEIQGRLRKIEDSLPEPDKYESEIGTCMSGELRIWCVRYVKAPPPKLREELVKELTALRGQMRTLKLRERNLARRAQRRRQADQKSVAFEKQLKKVLEEAEKRGSLEGDELAEVLDGSEKVLANYVNILRTNPSIDNIDTVLQHMVTPFLLGADALQGTSSEALNELGRASVVLAKRAEEDFQKVPSVGNFDRLLSRQVLRMQVGGEGNWHLPEPPRVGKKHTVASGETLSGISKHYYGDPGYWPTIYMQNFTDLDPKKLKPGTMLLIP